MPRKPWGEQELAELAAMRPYQRGAIDRHASRWGRKKTAVSAKLTALRIERKAVDSLPAPGEPFPVHRFD